jgi:threonine/homoserine/homoserine lactone efflux protein
VGRYLVSGIIFAFAAGIQPGPLQTYYITHALLYGWRKTLPSILAPLFSDIPIITIVLFALHITSKLFLQILQCAGGVFLLFLAFGAWKNRQKLKRTDLVPLPSQRKTLLKAVGVNLLNPNPYLGWSLVMGPLFLTGWGEAPVNGIALLGGFYGTLILCSAGIIFIFASARNLGHRVIKTATGISVLALTGFGIYQLWSGLMR